MLNSWVKPLFRDVKNLVLDTLFPVYCLVCEKPGEFVCLDCLNKLERLEFQHCPVCNTPSPFGQTHPKCQTPLGPDGLWCFFNYRDENLSEIIIRGKYYFLPEIFVLLGKFISSKPNELPPASPDLLVPVPLHFWRKKWRGFNQSEVLCQELSKNAPAEVAQALRRNKWTRTQKDLKKDQRERNVKGAFAIAEGAGIKGKNILLVDDVVTTGATLREAALVLKRNGAKTVWCLALARD